MPRIPERGRRVDPLQTRVPQVQTARSGVGQSVIRASQQALGVAQEIVKKQKAAQDSDYVFSKTSEFSQFVQENEVQQRTEASEDGQGHAFAVEDSLLIKRDEILEAAPSQEARRDIERRLQPVFQRSLARAKGFERTTQVKFFLNNINSDIDGAARIQQDRPDPTQAILSIKNFSEHIDSGVESGLYDASTAAEKKKQMNETVAMSVINGLDQAERFEDAEALVRGSGTLAQAIGPNEKARILSRLERRSRSRDAAKAQRLNSRIKDEILVRRNQGQISDSVLLADIDGNQRLSPEQKVRAKQQLLSASAVGETVSDLKVAPASEWNDIVASFDQEQDAVTAEALKNNPELRAGKDEAFGAAEKLKNKQLVLGQLRQIAQQRREDPAQYILGNYPQMDRLFRQAQGGDAEAMTNYITESLARQEQLQIPKGDRRITTRTQSSQLAQQINTASSAREKAQAIAGFQQAFGANSGRVLNEMIADKQIPEGLRMAIYVDTQDAKTRIIENATNLDAIQESFKKQRDPGELNDLKRAVAEEFEEIREAMVFGGVEGINASNAMSDQVLAESMKSILTSQDKISKREAVQQAVESTILSTYHISDVANSKVLIPRRNEKGSNNQIEFIEAHMRAHLRGPGLESLNLQIPKNETFTNLPEGERKKRWLEDVEDRGVWRMNAAQNGVVLHYNHPVRGPIPLLDANGDLVEASYEEISTNANQFTLDEVNKGFFSKVADRIF